MTADRASSAPLPLPEGSAIAANRPPTPRHPTMRDFVTDGSIAGLCDRLTRLTGAPVWLRDASGQVIVPGEGRGGEGEAWRLVPAGEGIARAFALVGVALPSEAALRAAAHTAEMRISTGPLGAIEAFLANLPGGTDERVVREAVTLLASSVCDVCEAQVSLRRRVVELDSLYRLSSLLTQTADLDALLRDAAHLAVSTLSARGGVILLTDRAPPAAMVQVGLTPREAETLAGMLQGEAAPPASVDGGRLAVAPLQFHSRTFGMLALVGPQRLDEASFGLLRSFAEHIAAAVSDARLRQLREEHERVQQQVRLAADVQRRMLPRQEPSVPGLDVAASYTPSFELGGDFYDFLDLGGNVGIAVGDVVGKGVAAALLMSAVRASLRAHAEDVYDLRDVLARVNRALVRDTHDHEFATLFYGVIEPASLRLTHVSAGHEPALLLRPRGRQVEVQELHSGGMVLGVDAAQVFAPGVVQLRQGDALVLYTDGLTDAADFQGRRFGRKRLREILTQLLDEEPDAGAARMIEQVAWHLRQFAGLSTRTDDVTIVAIRVRS